MHTLSDNFYDVLSNKNIIIFSYADRYIAAGSYIPIYGSDG